MQKILDAVLVLFQESLIGYFDNNDFIETGDKDVLIVHTNYGEKVEPKLFN